MFVKQIKKPMVKPAYLLWNPFEKMEKPTHKTIRSLGTATNENELEIILKSAPAFIAAIKEN